MKSGRACLVRNCHLRMTTNRLHLLASRSKLASHSVLMEEETETAVFYVFFFDEVMYASFSALT